MQKYEYLVQSMLDGEHGRTNIVRMQETINSFCFCGWELHSTMRDDRATIIIFEREVITG